MPLQLDHLAAKVPPTPPTPHISMDPVAVFRVGSADVVVREGEVGEWDEEGVGEAVVVVASLEGDADHVDAENVDVDMAHAWVGVDADEDLGGPVARWGYTWCWWLGSCSGVDAVGSGEVRVASLQDGGDIPAELGGGDTT